MDSSPPLSTPNTAVMLMSKGDNTGPDMEDMLDNVGALQPEPEGQDTSKEDMLDADIYTDNPNVENNDSAPKSHDIDILIILETQDVQNVEGEDVTVTDDAGPNAIDAKPLAVDDDGRT